MGEASNLIERISKASDQYGNLLVRFMERYGLSGLASASAEQLKEFIREENIA